MRVVAVFLLATVLAVSGCASEDEDGRPSVVATTTQVADLAREVAGSRAAMDQILQPNADPHDFEPRPSDARALERADVVLRSGGEVDQWLGDLIDASGTDARSIQVFPDRDDPHWWQDPRNAERAVAAIRAALTEADPGGRRRYARNARAYLGRLRRLDAGVERCIDELPRRARKLVTTHDALGYYADRYGLEVIGAVIPSRSSQAQPSSKDVNRLTDQIREQGVKAIFPESSLSSKLEKAISRESGAGVGGRLWADTLGPEGSSGDTYVRSIASNTETIVKGLSGGRIKCRPAPGTAGTLHAR